MHRRRRLGHRTQLYRLRPAGQRCHHPHVRGRAQLPGRLALLAGDRQAQGQYLLHRADRDPRADARRRRPGPPDLAQQPAPARLGGRADQPGGLGVVLPGGRREALPHRRHLVADRDRQHPDHPVARRHCAKARLGYPPVLRRATRAARRERQGNRRRGQRRTGDQGQLAESDPQRLRRPPADDRHLLQALPRVLLQRRRRAPRRGRLLLDHRPGRRRDQCLRTPDRHRRGRERAGPARCGGRGGSGRLPA
ncbi:Uncharacterised protein [Klebsiella pneumoniae]|nr:Uncharacterised protein [Klebsiella pneumoniae]